ncbi:MAG TPA: helix-turn-helix transcriptional regulator [Puia sp.]|nr:helix-turn-helix transcriptional regulator [Puia sp.]
MDIADRFKREQKSLGETLLKLRKIRHISQKELAKICGLSVRVIRRIEKGEANPEFKTLMKLAVGLKIPLKILFDYKDNLKRSLANSINLGFNDLESKERRKLGKRILDLCKHRKISQEELSVLSNIAASDMSLYINGDENLVLLTLLKIAIGLEVDIVDLFNHRGPMPDNKTFKGKIQF